MEGAENKCLFRDIYKEDCSVKLGKLSTNRDRNRVDSIVFASQKREDNLHTELSALLSENPDIKIQYHSSCVSRYCSTKSIPDKADPTPKRQRRSDVAPFDFKKQCLYCGLDCQLVPSDSKHPDRWRKARLAETTVYFCKVRNITISQTQYIQETCQSRGDDWGDQVLLRTHGLKSDVVASDVRYHEDCRIKFFTTTSTEHDEVNEDKAFSHVIETVTADKTVFWNGVELYNLYTSNNNDVRMDKKAFIVKLLSELGCSFIPFHNRGASTLYCFKENARVVLKEAKENRSVECQDEDVLCSIATKIRNESKQNMVDRNTYSSHIDLETAMDCTSDTLIELLEYISPKFHNSLYGALIGNIVTSIVQDRTTPLMLSLGTLLRSSKDLLNHFYDYRVTCTHDEMLRFKKSAASYFANLPYMPSIPLNDLLLQIITDNYDTVMHSQNNKLLCHCLATIVTRNGEKTTELTFPRLKKKQMSEPIKEANAVEVSTYIGPKKPPMPAYEKKSLDEEFLRRQKVSRERSEVIDFEFFLDMAMKKDCPEHNGYCTRLTREQGQSRRPKTQTTYLPLLDMKPADFSTMLTSMKQAKVLSSKNGQSFTVYTSDQQLYRIGLLILWRYPDLGRDFYLRLGGMHLLMSFIGSIGSLMAGSGLKEVLEKGFDSVPKMLTGKKFPQCVRALRLVVEELLRPVLKNGMIISHDKLMTFLDEKASLSRTTKLWVDVLIKQMFLCCRYLRAEREGDWALHLSAVEDMLPLFYAAGHVNYARDALVYLNDMKGLPENVLKHFMKGEHTVQHTEAFYNGMWTDYGIESTYMRFGHSSTGIVGQAMKPETVKVWAYSMCATTTMTENLEKMRDKATSSSALHKEEMPSRIAKDEVDRSLVRKKLEVSINVFDHTNHPKVGIVNIVSGKVFTSNKLNVDESCTIGKKLLSSFESGLPENFYEPIPRTVITIENLKKGVKIGEKKVVNPEVIYARALAMRWIDPDFDFEKLLESEMAPHPTSQFNKEGLPRSSDKYKLTNNLKVQVPARNASQNVDAIFLDGCAILWVINWPAKGNVSDFVNNFKAHVGTRLKIADVYLIFDRYFEQSIKGLTRKNRDKGGSRVYQLTLLTSLPARDVLLTVTENKVQLINIIIESILETPDSFYTEHKLVITGPDPIPFEIMRGIVSSRPDLETNQEEADTILIHQVYLANRKNSVVVADDADVFALLLHFVSTGDIKGTVIMEPTSIDKHVIDINATVEKHADIAPHILAAHAISGCDTVSALYGIGKPTVINALRKGKISLQSVGDLSLPIEEVIKEGISLFLQCYGHANITKMTDARIRTWKKKVAANNTAPLLESLPPTDATISENIKRGHLQAAIWLSALLVDPPDVDIRLYGWNFEPDSSSLCPLFGPPGMVLVPDEVLKIMKCGCQSAEPCKGGRCSCSKVNLSCTTFCDCEGGVGCHNQHKDAQRRNNDSDDC